MTSGRAAYAHPLAFARLGFVQSRALDKPGAGGLPGHPGPGARDLGRGSFRALWRCSPAAAGGATAQSSSGSSLAAGSSPAPSSIPPEREPEPLPGELVFVREIRVVGSTVFSPEQLAEVTAPYVNRELTAEDLETVRLALTRYYVDRGYVNSGAIIPEQTVTEGVLTLQIIEGKLTRIEVEGNRWFRASYLQKRLALGAGPPLNINDLQQRLQLLLQDNRFQRLNAELRPGVQPGESVLDVLVEEQNPYKAWLEFNNYQSPTVGAERGLITVAHQNLTGHGDILSVQYGRSSGVDLQLDASYLLPLTARDLTLLLQYRRNTFLVVEAPFEPLDIDSTSEIFGVTLRQPIYRTLDQEVALALTGERLSNRTFCLGSRSPFPSGHTVGYPPIRPCASPPNGYTGLRRRYWPSGHGSRWGSMPWGRRSTPLPLRMDNFSRGWARCSGCGGWASGRRSSSSGPICSCPMIRSCRWNRSPWEAATVCAGTGRTNWCGITACWPNWRPAFRSCASAAGPSSYSWCRSSMLATGGTRACHPRRLRPWSVSGWACVGRPQYSLPRFRCGPSSKCIGEYP
jgi:POTRA domain, ShlB-type/Haemolysin secretion/activation protein ShlB/FhaC/HecB